MLPKFWVKAEVKTHWRDTPRPGSPRINHFLKWIHSPRFKKAQTHAPMSAGMPIEGINPSETQIADGDYKLWTLNVIRGKKEVMRQNKTINKTKQIVPNRTLRNKVTNSSCSEEKNRWHPWAGSRCHPRQKGGSVLEGAQGNAMVAGRRPQVF